MFQKVFVDFWVDFYNKIPVTVTVSEYQEGFDAKWPHFTINLVHQKLFKLLKMLSKYITNVYFLWSYDVNPLQ